MKNFVQSGGTLVTPAPVGGVTSGQLVLVGTQPGVAVNDAAAGADVVLHVTGVYDVPKAAGAITQGAKVYFDAAAKNVTTTASGNTLVGTAWAAADAGASTAQVKIG